MQKEIREEREWLDKEIVDIAFHIHKALCGK